MKLATNAFLPWKNGHEQETILKGSPTGIPFVVRASTEGWLPLNLLVFADNEDDAIQRVKDGLQESIKVSEERYKRELDGDDLNLGLSNVHLTRFKKLLELFDKPHQVQVEKYNPEYITKVAWDGRGLG